MKKVCDAGFPKFSEGTTRYIGRRAVRLGKSTASYDEYLLLWGKQGKTLRTAKGDQEQ